MQAKLVPIEKRKSRGGKHELPQTQGEICTEKVMKKRLGSHIERGWCVCQMEGGVIGSPWKGLWGTSLSMRGREDCVSRQQDDGWGQGKQRVQVRLMRVQEIDWSLGMSVWATSTYAYSILGWVPAFAPGSTLSLHAAWMRQSFCVGVTSHAG